MASGTALPVFPEFDIRDQTNLAQRWEKYLKRFNNLMKAMNITDEGRKRALLLHYTGDEVNDLFETLPDKGDDEEYTEACDALTTYFTPKKNVSFEIFKFRNLKQEAHETVDEFHTRLQIASKYCEFGDDKEKEIKAQIELGTSNKKVRRHSFRSPTLTLTQLLNYARTLHETEKQAKGIEAKNRDLASSFSPDADQDDINKIQFGKQESSKFRKTSKTRNTKQQASDTSDTTRGFQRCFRCGDAWPHKGRCPAEGQQCRNCSKYNHFARVCRAREMQKKPNESSHAVWNTARSPPSSTSDNTDSEGSETSTSNDNEGAFIINEIKANERAKKQRSFHANLKLGKSTIRFQIDSGSTVNIIDENTFQAIKKQNPDIILRKTRKRLFGFGSKAPLPVLGQIECLLESKQRITSATIVVVKGTTGCLLSGQTSIDLKFLTVKVNKVQEKPAFSKLASQDKVPPRLKPVISKYDKVFHGVGKLTDVQVQLHINKEVRPVVQPTRRIPFAIRKKVEHELDRLEKEDIIQPAKGPSIWVSPIVAFPKPNNPDQLRLCIDMRQANYAILRERHPQPTIDDLIHDLNGAQHFSKLDLSSAYHQLELDGQSRYITTFIQPIKNYNNTSV